MNLVFDILIKMTRPLWASIAAHPWVWTALFALASVICFALDVPYIRVIFGAAAGATLIFKSEQDLRLERSQQPA